MNGTHDREPADGDIRDDTAESDDAPPRPPEVMACLRVVGILFVFLFLPAVIFRFAFYLVAGSQLEGYQVVAGVTAAGLVAFATVGWQLLFERRCPRLGSIARVSGASAGYLPTLFALSADADGWSDLRDLALSYPLSTVVAVFVLMGPAFVGWLQLHRRVREDRGVAWPTGRKRAFLTRFGIGVAALGVIAAVTYFLYLRDEPPPDVSDLRSRVRPALEDENGLRVLITSETPDPLYVRELMALEASERDDLEPWPSESDEEGLNIFSSYELSFIDPLDVLGDRVTSEKAAEFVSVHGAALEQIEHALRLPFGPVPNWNEAQSWWIVSRAPVLCVMRLRLALDRDDTAGAFSAALTLRRLGSRLVNGCDWEAFEIGEECRRTAEALLLRLIHRSKPGEERSASLRVSTDADRVSAGAFASALASGFFQIANHRAREEGVWIRQGQILDGSKASSWLTRWIRHTQLRPNRTRRILADWARELITASEHCARERVPPVNQAALHEVGILVPLAAEILAPYDQLRCRDALLDALLAVLLYEHDHGELPATLTDLVPAYAPAAPADPYTGGPLRYDREARVIYSLGPAGIDAGPSEETDPAAALVDEYFPTARIP